MSARAVAGMMIFCLLFAWVLGTYLVPMFSANERYRLSWLGVSFVAGVGVKTTFSILIIRWWRKRAKTKGCKCWQWQKLW